MPPPRSTRKPWSQFEGVFLVDVPAFEKRSCALKRKWNTEAEAKRAAKALKRLDRREGVTERGAVRAYRCKRCLQWHIGHSSRSTE